MDAMALMTAGQPLQKVDRPPAEPGAGEVVVRLRAAALNRRDYWIQQGLYPGIVTPVVLGSDGAGVVTACGPGVDQSQLDREVVINPGLDWGENPRAQSAAFTILGMPRDGTFAQEVVVPAEQLYDKPVHMSWEQAAALPLAGVTAWRAVFTQGNAEPGERVLVTGIGGGVATFALQFAVEAGATVHVTSSSQEKLRRAAELGAVSGFNYRQPDWTDQLSATAGNPDLIIDSAAGPGYAALLDVAAHGGRIVNYGATAGPPEKLAMFKVFWKQLRLQGSTMGSPADFAGMLSLVNATEVQPAIDQVLPLEEVNTALALMANSQQFGKLVLAIP